MAASVGAIPDRPAPVQGRNGRFAFRPAGSNTLTTYLLPDYWDIILSLLGITFLAEHFGYGWHGVAKSLVFTCLMLAIAALLTRMKVRLAL